MLARSAGKFLVCAFVLWPVLLLAPPAAGQSSVRELGKLLSHCTEQHGYSVSVGNALADYALGDGELEWRRCVYDGIRTSLMKSAPFPDLYAELIKDDKALTAGIRAKQVTRAQRSENNLASITRIQARESEHAEARRKSLRERAKTEEAIRETRRILDLQERLDNIRRAALEGLR